MITDLEEIRKLAELKQAENVEFRRRLHGRHDSLEPFRILATQVRDQIDCTTCGNCCRYTTVAVAPAEIARIGAYLGLTTEEALQRYTLPDQDEPGQSVLANRHDSCVFLDGNLCLIYEARPQACRDFPHVALRTHTLGGRLESICRHASFCPILFNALEEYKKQVGFHPHHRVVSGR